MNEIAKILVTLPEPFEVYLFSNSIFDSTLDTRFLYVQVGNQLDELTKNVDLVLTTSSTSSLEFLARGLCVGVACAVDNQEQYYKSLGELGWQLKLDCGILTINGNSIRRKSICSLPRVN